MVSNHVHPTRPPLQSWRSTDRAPSRPAPSGSSLSCGVGLEHIALMANVAGITAELWQEGDTVFFRATKRVFVLPAASVAPEPEPEPPVDAAALSLHIACLDDSAIACKTLSNAFEQHLPNCVVRTFGKDPADVEKFKRWTQKRCDIVVVDQNLDFPGECLLGTDVVEELIAAGYRGLVCVRSGNNSAADGALYRQSGAHCHLGKDVRMKALVEALVREYVALHQSQSSGLLGSATPPPLLSKSVPS